MPCPPARGHVEKLQPKVGEGAQAAGTLGGEGQGWSKGSRSTHTPSRSHGMLGGTCCPDPAPTPSPGTESTRAHRHRPRGGGPRLDRGATGSHSGLGGAEVRDGWDWTSWSLEGGWLRTQRAHPRAPWEHSHPPGSPPRVQAGGCVHVCARVCMCVSTLISAQTACVHICVCLSGRL